VRALPDFPWDSLAPFKERASAVPGGIVDLSIGTPVDPTPAILQEALRAAADAPGYPQTWGTPDLREAVATWFEARRGVPGLDPAGVIPTIGSKELVAWLPTLLDLGPGDIVGFPRVAYPTYDVGARLAGATPLPVDALTSLGPLTPSTTPKLLWLNTPGNPTGKVLGVEHLRKVVDWARGHGVIVASDECYAELDWRDRSDPSIADWRREPPTTPSLLDPRVTGGSHEGLLVCYSLSKQSNLAGYRAAFLAGDTALVKAILEVRKHAGFMVPWPPRSRPGMPPAGQPSSPRSSGGACASTTPRPGSTSGRRPVRTPGPPWAGWPNSASWPPPAPSTAPPGLSTSGSRSPAPTSGSRPPLPGWVPDSPGEPDRRAHARVRSRHTGCAGGWSGLREPRTRG
jgi:succinyldiaminopimelate transaminase